jgi:hypothetical protein
VLPLNGLEDGFRVGSIEPPQEVHNYGAANILGLDIFRRFLVSFDWSRSQHLEGRPLFSSSTGLELVFSHLEIGGGGRGVGERACPSPPFPVPFSPPTILRNHGRPRQSAHFLADPEFSNPGTRRRQRQPYPSDPLNDGK